MVVQGLKKTQLKAVLRKELQRPVSAAGRDNSNILCLSNAYAVDVTIVRLDSGMFVVRPVNKPRDKGLSTVLSLNRNGLEFYLKTPLLSPETR